LDKARVAEILEEIGTLLELKGENPFKSRAYHNGGRILAALDQDLETLVRENKLSTIKGIGEGLSEKITTLVTTGHLPYYDELQKSLPPGLMDLIRIQGVGPKRAKILYDELKIKDIPGLEKACRAGKVAALEGFGEKSQENILKSLEFFSQHAEQHRFDEALGAAESVLASLKEFPEIKRLSVCGSLRRHKEVIRDVDILASAKDGAKVLEKVTQLPQVERVLGQGETKASVLLREGIQVDVRVVKDREFPYALHYFTGSKEHNIAMRQRAIARGWKLSEYGLFDKGGRPIPCKEETDIFKKLGLPYIPPELREDRGEIEAAEKGKLPQLIEAKDLRGALHVHSTWSDGKATLEDMIAEAERLGWEFVGISEHSKSAAYARGLTEDRLRAQRKEIDELRRRFKIAIFWGIECDILKDGSLDYADPVLADFDFVIASVHSSFSMSESDMTRRIVRALQNKSVTVLGHPTGRLLLEREGYAVDQGEVIRAAADLGVAMELNAHPQRFDIDWREIPKAKELGVKISIGPDAHSVEGLSVLSLGVGIARKGWLTKDDVVNTYSLGKIQTWLKARR
jgi:DNA polymerase (family X)